MFKLLFEPRSRVLMVRYGGVLSSDDIRTVDACVTGIVAREGFMRSIYDLTAIEAFAIPPTKLSWRGRNLRMNPGQDRVFVVPQDDLYGLYRDYAQQQLDIGNGEMKIVRQLAEALKLLQVKRAGFRPLPVVALAPFEPANDNRCSAGRL